MSLKNNYKFYNQIINQIEKQEKKIIKIGWIF